MIKFNEIRYELVPEGNNFNLVLAQPYEKRDFESVNIDKEAMYHLMTLRTGDVVAKFTEDVIKSDAVLHFQDSFIDPEKYLIGASEKLDQKGSVKELLISNSLIIEPLMMTESGFEDGRFVPLTEGYIHLDLDDNVEIRGSKLQPLFSNKIQTGEDERYKIGKVKIVESNIVSDFGITTHDKELSVSYDLYLVTAERYTNLRLNEYRQSAVFFSDTNKNSTLNLENMELNNSRVEFTGIEGSQVVCNYLSLENTNIIFDDIKNATFTMSQSKISAPKNEKTTSHIEYHLKEGEDVKIDNASFEIIGENKISVGKDTFDALDENKSFVFDNVSLDELNIGGYLKSLIESHKKSADLKKNQPHKDHVLGL